MKNSGTNKHDLVGVVSWGDGCAAVGMVIMMLVIIVHEVVGDKDDEDGEHEKHDFVGVNTIKSVLHW